MKAYNLPVSMDVFEGYRYLAYKDDKGIWTYGWGFIRKPDGTPVKEGDTITETEADTYLIRCMAAEVDPYINKLSVKLSETQKDALRFLVHNVGGPSFAKSKLFKAINDIDYAEIFRQWDWDVKTGRRGAIKRRAMELALFLQEPIERK